MTCKPRKDESLSDRSIGNRRIVADAQQAAFTDRIAKGPVDPQMSVREYER